MLAMRRFLTTMTTQTHILKVNKHAIQFDSDLPTISDPDTLKNLQIASQIIKSGDVVAFPTETVYGLGGSALNDDSVRAIYKAKNRPSDNPLITHVSSISQLERRLGVNVPDIYKPLIEKFWPGPLTILLPIPQDCPLSQLTTASQPTFAVRIPSHTVARALIAISDTPVAAPSANASTRPSPTMAEHVYHDLQGRIPCILDGGLCDVGVESTVVDGLVSPPLLLRPGGVSLEEIREFGGPLWANVKVEKPMAAAHEQVRTPGMKYKHYSPKARVVLFMPGSNVSQFLDSEETTEKIAMLHSRHAIAGSDDTRVTISRELGTRGADISQNLFKLLREVDEEAGLILVEGIDDSNEGLAVMNRLRKAASVVVSV